jgi:hypothetical protein
MLDIGREHPDWAEDAMLARTSPPYGIINTFSNIVYPAIGIYAWLTGGAWLFGLCMFWLVIGSGCYHCWKKPWGEMMDDSGMWSMFGLFLMGWYGAVFGALYGFVNWLPRFERRKISHRTIIKVCAVAIPLVFFAKALLLKDIQIVLTTVHAAAWFAVGYVFWLGGKHRVDFDGQPEVFTPRFYSHWCHGVWHLLTAIGFYVLVQVG